MKKYKIKYQKGNDICVVEIIAVGVISACMEFYMNTPTRDIISIEEVT